MKRYRIGKLLATGGMAEIYEGWRMFPNGERPVIIKRICAKHRHNEDAKQRFLRECSLCFDNNHDHPNLVTVYDFDQDREGAFMVMERLQGAPLSHLGTGDKLSYADVRRILVEMLNALAYIHDRGILHRDISPANIFITRAGGIKLIDFGLACRIADQPTTPGFKGTAAFASPEALAEQCLTPAADLYSLGAVIYMLLAGRPPHGNGTRFEICNLMGAKEMGEDDIIQAAPDDLRNVLTGLLEVEPSRRPFRSAYDALKALREHREPMSSPAALGELALQGEARAAHQRQAEPALESAKASQRTRNLRLSAAAGLGIALLAWVAHMLMDSSPVATVSAPRLQAATRPEPVSPPTPQPPGIPQSMLVQAHEGNKAEPSSSAQDIQKTGQALAPSPPTPSGAERARNTSQPPQKAPGRQPRMVHVDAWLQ